MPVRLLRAIGLLVCLLFSFSLSGCKTVDEGIPVPAENTRSDSDQGDSSLDREESLEGMKGNASIPEGLSMSEAKRQSNLAIKHEGVFYPIYGSTSKMVDESLAVPLEDEAGMFARLSVDQGDELVSFDGTTCYYRSVLGEGYCSYPVSIDGVHKDSVDFHGLPNSIEEIAELDGKDANKNTLNDILASKGVVGSSAYKGQYSGYLIGEEGTWFTYGAYVGVDFIEGTFSIDKPYYLTEVPELGQKSLENIKTKEGYMVLDTSVLSPGRYYLESRIGSKYGMALLDIV